MPETRKNILELINELFETGTPEEQKNLESMLQGMVIMKRNALHEAEPELTHAE